MSLNLLEPSGPVQACNWIALPLPLPLPLPLHILELIGGLRMTVRWPKHVAMK